MWCEGGLIMRRAFSCLAGAKYSLLGILVRRMPGAAGFYSFVVAVSGSAACVPFSVARGVIPGCAAVILSLTSASCFAGNDEEAMAEEVSVDGGGLEVGMKTLGGRQFWGDVVFFQGWTIQKNVVTGHFRLLDPQDHRHAWGSRERCESRLAEIRQQAALPPMEGHAVVLLHGIVRSSKAMSRIANRLEAEGYLVVPFDYPSTREGLSGCANYLDQVVRSLEGVERVSFVGHSMGGLVVRKWMAEYGDDRVGRFVMLGTPNHGAELADRFGELAIFRLILGAGGRDLRTDAGGEIAQLPIPRTPFAVIAGARGDARGFNLLVSGDDDGVVSVESARLDGAEAYLEVPVLHSFLPYDQRVIDAVSAYLVTGTFGLPVHQSPNR
jgi:pimeloyl-ACP methyl ester carboxylesterase